MATLLAAIVQFVVIAYSAVGMLVGLWVVTRRLVQIDSMARGAPVTMRLLILPGVVALWPWFAMQFLRRRKARS